jgi:hypothetical protein
MVTHHAEAATKNQRLITKLPHPWVRWGGGRL